jgi:hypothetical protein
MGENLYKKVGEYIPDKLIAGNAIPITAKGITVAKGQGVLKRGTLLGIAHDKTHKKTDTTETYEGSSGSQTDTIGADCILCEDIDATDSDVVTAGYETGEFNADAVILPEEKNIDAHAKELRKLGLYIKQVQEH